VARLRGAEGLAEGLELRAEHFAWLSRLADYHRAAGNTRAGYRTARSAARAAAHGSPIRMHVRRGRDGRLGRASPSWGMPGVVLAEVAGDGTVTLGEPAR
jgi:hypothetical protein